MIYDRLSLNPTIPNICLKGGRQVKFTKNVKRCFASSVAVAVLLSISSISSITPASAAGGKLADDNLLVLLAPHADRVSAQAHLKNEAHANTLHDLHINADDYSILHVQPPSGQREQTLSAIQTMMKTHPEIKSVTRNYVRHRLIHLGVGGDNDPDFSTQWPLAAMRWSAAQSTVSQLQKQPATITVLSQGQHPVAQGNELGAYIKQYDASGNTDTVVREVVSGIPGGVEGDIDSSITGCLSNNGVLIAGAGSFKPSVACLLTSIKITNDAEFANNFNIYLGFAYALNNQKERRGPGPINLSFGDDQNPVWADPIIQALGQSALNQGDLIVVSAGDTPGDNIGLSVFNVEGPPEFPPITNPPSLIPSPAAPLGSIVVVQASANINNPPSQINPMLLTEVGQGAAAGGIDPYAAPGDVQPAVIDGVFNEGFLGSSFSAPLWCSAIAMVRSVNPSLSSAQANAIVRQTGTPMVGFTNYLNALDPIDFPGVPIAPAPNTVFIPAFDRAILSATGH